MYIFTLALIRFAPTRASGFVNGVWTTYAGRIAKDAFMEIAFDAKGGGFCKLHSEKLGMPTRRMVAGALADGIAKGSKLTRDGAPAHNLLVKRLALAEEWCKFVPGDREYEAKMKLMSNCCSYLRHSFESHVGIKFSKLEAYGNFFLYRWRMSENAASRTLYRSWFRGSMERRRATNTGIHSEKRRCGFDFVPTFAPISSTFLSLLFFS